MIMEEITKYLDSGYLWMYLDFQKAFDKVPHGKIVSKLAAHGISGDPLRSLFSQRCKGE